MIAQGEDGDAATGVEPGIAVQTAPVDEAVLPAQESGVAPIGADDPVGQSPQHHAPDRTIAPLVQLAAARPSRFDLSQYAAQTRLQQISAAMAGAFSDPVFRGHIEAGDAARDRCEWSVAEQRYGQGLVLFPLHWGYLIQYAHAIKEQGLFERAEAFYRSACALGAPVEMVDEHLAFVAGRNGVRYEREGMPDLAVAPLLAPPTVHDIAVIVTATGLGAHIGMEQTLPLLRARATNLEVLLDMVRHRAFAGANRGFLELLRG